ncbi:MAG: M3 family oligoendopeptidase [Anaerolineaceae bacterium]|nr:M3 family oligoendopeptidase [Anaerolineaceae bacterium]
MTDSTLSYTQTSWSLTDLLPSTDSSVVEAQFSTIKDKVNAFAETTRAKLESNIAGAPFLNIIQELEDITRHSYHLYGFASLSFSSNTQDPAAQTLLARVQQFMAEMQNQTLFFELWWKQLDDENAERLMASVGDYGYWLEEMRHFKKFTLSEPEEKIINIKDVTGTSAVRRLYDSITNRYTYKLTINGEEKELTRGELMVYVRQADPEMRANAYQELYRVFSNDAPILGQIYQTLVRDWRNENIQLRGFSSPISVRNLVNNIPDDVVETLLAVCQKNSPVFQRYFRLKARWIGMERLRRYDVYAPVAQSEKLYPFDKAAKMVLDSFNEFDPEIAGMAQRVFDQNHLDSEVRKGKRNGAFCSTVDSEITPWVLLNYQGRAEDVATMAHELGHAIHSMLAADHSLFTFHPSLPLAETASTFGEMMLVDRLLQEESDEKVRRDILFRQVDDAYATIMRQAFFALFERQAHEMVQQNASVEEIADAYIENLRSQFGDAVEISDEFRWEWISIPHIYSTPFYVYAYSFGQLLVLSLYQQFKQEGESFKPRYRKILATGGAEAPVKILADAGIDVRDPAFWQGGFDVISNLVSELEALPIQE